MGDVPLEAFDQVQHEVPMLSLDKCYTEEELLAWVFDKRSKEGARRFAGPVLETPTVDGVAASFRYDQTGRLVGLPERAEEVEARQEHGEAHGWRCAAEAAQQRLREAPAASLPQGQRSPRLCRLTAAGRQGWRG